MKKVIHITIALLAILSCCMIAYIGSSGSERPTATSSTRVEATSAPTDRPVEESAASQGLNVSREEVMSPFRDLGFSFEKGVDNEEGENWIGTRSGVSVQIIGPADNIAYSAVIAGISYDNQTASIENMLYQNGLIKVAAPDWEEGLDWYNAAFKRMGQAIQNGETFFEEETSIDSRRYASMQGIALTDGIMLTLNIGVK